jgi:hypothetical protein
MRAGETPSPARMLAVRASSHHPRSHDWIHLCQGLIFSRITQCRPEAFKNSRLSPADFRRVGGRDTRASGPVVRDRIKEPSETGCLAFMNKLEWWVPAGVFCVRCSGSTRLHWVMLP